MNKELLKYEKIKEDLKCYLETNDISMREFARIANINIATVSNFLKNKKVPGIKSIHKIINIIDKDVCGYINMDGIPFELLDVKLLDFEGTTVERIDIFINELRDIRNNMLKQELQDLHEKESRIKRLLDEE